MKKIHLVMGDKDTQYMELFANYIRTTEQASLFSIKFFSQQDNLSKYIEEQSYLDILLVSPSFLPPNWKEMSSSTVIKLEDDGLSPVEVDVPAVFKFQPLNKLLSEVLSVYYDQHGKKQNMLGAENKTQIISVYSPTGGTGKSTLAVNLCRQIALQNQSVFYLNLELLNSTPLFFSSYEESSVSSQVLYYAKANPKQLVSKIESLKKHDDYTKIDFFELSVSAEEMLDLSLEDVEQLITGLIDTENYDFIVVDMDSAFDKRTRVALKKSTQIFWLLNNDLQSAHKSAYLFQQLDDLLEDTAEDKLHVILNRHTGQNAAAADSYGISIDSYLPYIPEWKMVQDTSQLTSSPVFDEEVLKLFSNVFQPDRSVAVDG